MKKSFTELRVRREQQRCPREARPSFPRVLRMMASGELHLSAVTLLAPVLTEANADALLEQAQCKSKREVELIC